MNRRDALKAIVALPIVGPAVVKELGATTGWGTLAYTSIPESHVYRAAPQWIMLTRKVTLKELCEMFPAPKGGRA